MQIAAAGSVGPFRLSQCAFTLRRALVGPLAFAFSLPAAEDAVELRAPMDVLPPTFWQQHTLAVVILAACISLGLAAVAWWWFRPKPIPVEPEEAAARRALDRLRNQPEEPALLSQVARILRHYLGTVRHWRTEEFTTDELVAQLPQDPVLGPELAAALVVFFRDGDARRFSPVPPAAAAGAADRALELLDRIAARRREAQGLAPPEPGEGKAISAKPA